MVGCAGNLCIWAARTGDLLHKFTVAHGKEKLNHTNSRFDMTLLLTMNCVLDNFRISVLPMLLSRRCPASCRSQHRGGASV